MRHRQKKIKLGTDAEHTRSILRNLFTSLIEHEKITTTFAKAKALKQVADRLIEKAKKGDLSSRREVSVWLKNKNAYKKFFHQLLPHLSSRTGGHVRVIRTGYRKGDGALMAQVELLKEETK